MQDQHQTARARPMDEFALHAAIRAAQTSAESKGLAPKDAAQSVIEAYLAAVAKLS